MDDDRVLGLFFEIATGFGRMHGRLLAELSELEAISGNSADNLLRKEEAFIEALRDQGDQLAMSLLTAMVRAASEPVEQIFGERNGGRPPHGGQQP